ncbi:alpha/beta hydrolase-fold protein [Thalassotalea hakodatensis]|uniref:alpha/beta hydrolase-fold protein n=1 Tax=Thalassotalea hakodatensis TaxID=3030492 RepID=UPI00257408CB|nr:alpha/beta hydrolase-fold protein [Thalassotalea hakodatensis]
MKKNLSISYWLSATICFIVTSFNSFAEDNNINIGFKTEIASTLLQENYELWIHLPENYSDAKKYPVLYLLDGKNNFAHTVGTLSYLKSGERVPEMIVVGISSKNRMRDYTPTKIETRKSSGGGEKFLDFIEQELIPYINKKYSTESYKIFSGHSLGGLLVVHTLHSRPNLFQAHFAYSPSLYWNNKDTVKKTLDFLTHKKEFPNYLYINIGNEGLISDHPSGLAMRSAFKELNAKLKLNKPNNFLFRLDAFDREKHGTTPVVGQFNAFRDLYEPWFIPFEPLKEGLQAIEKYYQMLSVRYGYEVKPQKSIINEAADYHLNTNNGFNEAITLLKFNTKNYPTCIKCYSDLANAYERSGKFSEAIEQIDVAMKFSDELVPHLTEHKKRLLVLIKTQG